MSLNRFQIMQLCARTARAALNGMGMTRLRSEFSHLGHKILDLLDDQSSPNSSTGDAGTPRPTMFNRVACLIGDIGALRLIGSCVNAVVRSVIPGGMIASSICWAVSQCASSFITSRFSHSLITDFGFCAKKVDAESQTVLVKNDTNDTTRALQDDRISAKHFPDADAEIERDIEFYDVPSVSSMSRTVSRQQTGYVYNAMSPVHERYLREYDLLRQTCERLDLDNQNAVNQAIMTNFRLMNECRQLFPSNIYRDPIDEMFGFESQPRLILDSLSGFSGLDNPRSIADVDAQVDIPICEMMETRTADSTRQKKSRGRRPSKTHATSTPTESGARDSSKSVVRYSGAKGK